MKNCIITFIVALGFAAALVAGYVLYQHRPSRTVVTLNGRTLTAGEIDERARAFMQDVVKSDHLEIPPEREHEAMIYYRRLIAQLWVSTQILTSEALERNIQVDAQDEKDALADLTRKLKSRNLTPEQYFAQGPLSEEFKRRDFKETILITKLLRKVVGEKITIGPGEIEERFNFLVNRAKGTNLKPSRRQALDSLRAERFRAGSIQLYKEAFAKAKIVSTEMPELEDFVHAGNVIQPSRIPPGFRADYRRSRAKSSAPAKPAPSKAAPPAALESPVIEVPPTPKSPSTPSKVSPSNVNSSKSSPKSSPNVKPSPTSAATPTPPAKK